MLQQQWQKFIFVEALMPFDFWLLKRKKKVFAIQTFINIIVSMFARYSMQTFRCQWQNKIQIDNHLMEIFFICSFVCLLIKIFQDKTIENQSYKYHFLIINGLLHKQKRLFFFFFWFGIKEGPKIDKKKTDKIIWNYENDNRQRQQKHCQSRKRNYTIKTHRNLI